MAREQPNSPLARALRFWEKNLCAVTDLTAISFCLL
jgi:hypothetical protein